MWHVKGRPAKALADLDEAIRLAPEVARFYYNRGLVYGATSEYEKAVDDFDNAIRLKPDYAEAVYNRGATYSRMGQYEKAQQDVQNAFKMDPGLEQRIKAGNTQQAAPPVHTSNDG